MRAYEQLEERYRRALSLQSIQAVLHWDSAVMMPTAAAPARAEQLALLEVMHHEQLCDQQVESLLSESERVFD